MTTQNAKHSKDTNAFAIAAPTFTGGRKHKIVNFLSTTSECSTFFDTWAQIQKEWENESRT